MSSRRRVLERWTHPRALGALALTALVVSAVVYATRRSDDAPYTPGGAVEGITDENRKTAEGPSWGIAYEDVAAASGIDFTHFSAGARSTQLPEDMGSGVAFGDYDADGDWDLFVADVTGPLTLTPEELAKSKGGCRLYRNDGGRFTDVTEQAGLGGLKGAYMGAAWGDYDNDGFPDLAVSAYGGLRLLHNEGNGTFREVTKEAGLAPFHGFYTGIVWGDADGDGRLDLYVCNYVDYKYDPKDVARASKFRGASSPFTINPESYPPAPNLYFHNEGKGKFREMAAEAGVANPEGRSLSATFADFDDDGRPDLYVANDVSEGALFVNTGDGIFADRGHEAHVADYRGAMGIAVGDANGDGALDMFVTHWIAEANALYLNKLVKSGPHAHGLDFEDAAARTGLGEVSTDDIAWGTAFLDVDGDGLPDIVVANGSTFEDPKDTKKLVAMPMRLFRNFGEKGFVDVASQSGAVLTVPRVHRGLAVADVDGDLREEIAVVVHGGKLLLLKAKGGPANARVAFRVEGRRSNRSGYGTRLTVTAGGKRQVREIGAGSSYLSQNAPEAIFGLGAAAKVDLLEVRWPSGATQSFRDLPAGTAYKLVEGEAPVALGKPAPAAAAPVSSAQRKEDVLSFWDAYRDARAKAAGGDRKGAIEAYRRALALNPQHEDSHYSLANLLDEEGDRAGAIREMRELLRIQPRAARGHRALGDFLSDPASGPLEDLAEARKEYEAAGSIYQEETGWVVRVGEVELATGDAAAAEKSFRKVLVANRSSFEALYLLGYLADRRGDAKEAARLYAAAFEGLGLKRGPEASSEGDVKKAAKALPSRGPLAPYFAEIAKKVPDAPAAYARLASFLAQRRKSA